MNVTLSLAHERTLVGAVDSYLKELVHVRPFLAQRYADVLEGMAERWLDERGINAVNALDAAWVTNYIAGLAERSVALSALQDFYRWALHNKLIVENPFP
jgi:site-specific recombinase XerD